MYVKKLPNVEKEYTFKMSKCILLSACTWNKKHKQMYKQNENVEVKV